MQLQVILVPELLNQPILVVGGDSLVGRAVVDYLDSAGFSVFTTSRRTECVSSKCLALDLENSSAFSFQPSIVLLCASITNTAFVEKARAEARRVNVDAVVALARTLHESGSHIIYISSVGVFGDSCELKDTTASPFPANEYGQQKLDAERGLLALGSRLAVIRPTKIVSCATPMFLEWIERLGCGKEIQPFSDFFFCPVSLKFLTHSLAGLALIRPSGIFHLSGQSQVSYAEFAKVLAKSMGVAADTVVPTYSAEFKVPAFYPPRQPCLSMASTTALLGVQPQALQSVVDDLLSEYMDYVVRVKS